MEKISAQYLLYNCKRFDLIYKLLLLEHINDTKENVDYYTNLYLESIKAFNGFYEDYPRKISKQDFFDSFLKTYDSILTNGFDSDSPIPVNRDLLVYDGAHRLAIAAFLGIDVPIVIKDHNDLFDYKFFEKRGIDKRLADIGSLEFVRHYEKAHIVQVFPMVSKKMDMYIEDTLEKYGYIYYKKEFYINYNGIVRIKQVNYGKEEWAGNQKNDYQGLKKHAANCVGINMMRIYVFVCDSIDNAINAKTEIRHRLKVGNYPIHINDNHEEAVRLANLYFNDNGIDWLKSSPYNVIFDNIIGEFKDYCRKCSISMNSVCISSSAVLKIYGLRDAEDIDCIHNSDFCFVDMGNVSSHKTEERYYPDAFNRLINNHFCYLQIDGVKFLSLQQVKKFKLQRHEWPKDFKDIFLILIVKKCKELFMDLETLCYCFRRT